MPVEQQKCLKITAKELKALQERIAGRQLADTDYDLILGFAETIESLRCALAEKDASVGRLCKYLLGAPTETAKNVLKNRPKPQKEQKPTSAKPSKGHGRNPASAYTGAGRVTMEHQELKSGDVCPDCDKGKVYELAMPSVFVHITGEAPLKATVYERIRLRCNLCGQMYAPELPEGVGDKKYDDSAAAMIAVLKYGCGMPLNRLEKLQANLGQPVAASTQWDILDAAAVTLAPVHEALIDHAAQGKILYNDDTTAKVLSFIENQDPESTRKGIYTTGLVSKYQGRQIALFMTGNRHAGEHLSQLLQRRATGLPPPIQMCDAASRNASKEFETILSNCMAHARRQFVELVDRFPEECEYMIEQLGYVYHYDAIAYQEGMSAQERLDWHRQNSGPVMEETRAWCERQLKQKLVEPNSGLGKAVKYMLNHWQKLTRFLHVPGAPIDNNLCERALKHAILHRKNALFYKTGRGARVGDLFMSLIHSCQLEGVNPLDYLRWLLENARDMEKHPENYLPWHYSDKSQ
jgi:transposase